MSKELENMLLSNNQQLHGTIKMLYNQWWQAELIGIITMLVVAITITVVIAVMIHRFYKQYLAIPEDQSDRPDSFKKFMGYDHTAMVIIIMILAVTAFSTFLVAGINISELIIDPKVAFVRSLFANN